MYMQARPLPARPTAGCSWTLAAKVPGMMESRNGNVEQPYLSVIFFKKKLWYKRVYTYLYCSFEI